MFGIFGVIFLAYALIGIGAQANLYTLPAGVGGFFLTTSVPGGNQPIVCPTGTILQNGVCVSQTGGGANYQPTASYSARDKFSTTSVSGTSYYKVNGNSATTTAYTNTNVGDAITYWVSNTSYYVQPVSKSAHSGVTPFEALGWENSSVTITLYDTVGRATVTSGKSNITMGANGQANIEITYQGTAKGSAGPFGGDMVFEGNKTLASVTCTGDNLLSDNPYHLTYGVTDTNNAYHVWAYDSGLDDGTGKPKTVSCQVLNGATAVGTGSAYYVKFIPANYYVTNAGDIVLDTEKNANQDTTRTGLQTISATGYWG